MNLIRTNILRRLAHWNIALLAVLVSILSMSCEGFLDVKPEAQVEKEVFFSSEVGFLEALNGVYLRCTDEKFTPGQFLYGDELTTGILDVLAQNYTITGSSAGSFDFRYSQIVNYNYDDPYFITYRDGIWSGLYNAIGNCNLILENVDVNEGVFIDESNHDLVKGEALALRAYLHLDLLRMFAPSYLINSAAPAIPYVEQFDKEISAQLTVDEVLNKVIADLLAARTLLVEVDPIVNGDYTVGYTLNDNNDDVPDDGSNEELGSSLFLQNRRHRMNYYAVSGALARAYLYKADKENALKYAVEVIESGVFPWTIKEDFTAADPTLIDRILYKELIFGWAIPTMEDDLADRFLRVVNSTTISATEGSIIYEVGGVGAEDFRFKQWMKQESDGIVNRLLLQKYRREDDDDGGNLHPLMAPAMRLSEMYYIAAESIFDTNPNQAWEYFNTVRLHRGIGTEITGETSYEEFISELIKEARKEFYGEGQIFYMYKRLNRDIIGQSGRTITASDQVFVWPLPDDEIAFGNRN